MFDPTVRHCKRCRIFKDAINNLETRIEMKRALMDDGCGALLIYPRYVIWIDLE
jgi:hypothetical protein